MKSSMITTSIALFATLTTAAPTSRQAAGSVTLQFETEFATTFSQADFPLGKKVAVKDILISSKVVSAVGAAVQQVICTYEVAAGPVKTIGTSVAVFDRQRADGTLPQGVLVSSIECLANENSPAPAPITPAPTTPAPTTPVPAIPGGPGIPNQIGFQFGAVSEVFPFGTVLDFNDGKVLKSATINFVTDKNGNQIDVNTVTCEFSANFSSAVVQTITGFNEAVFVDAAGNGSTISRISCSVASKI